MLLNLILKNVHNINNSNKCHAAPDNYCCKFLWVIPWEIPSYLNNLNSSRCSVINKTEFSNRS